MRDDPIEKLKKLPFSLHKNLLHELGQKKMQIKEEPGFFGILNEIKKYLTRSDLQTRRVLKN